MTNRFSVLNHDYRNTGGGCMVSVFTVYDREAKALRYLTASSDGFNWQTVSTVGDEPIDDLTFDEIVLSSHEWTSLNWHTYEKELRISIEEMRLFKYCQFEFYKKEFDRSGILAEITINEVPEDMERYISAEYRAWAEENEAISTTNGYEVIYNDLFTSESLLKHDKELQVIKDFTQWYASLVSIRVPEEDMQKLYDDKFKIAIAGRYVEIPFNSDTFNKLLDTLNEVIKEW